jgi:hypothetical protein
MKKAPIAESYIYLWEETKNITQHLTLTLDIQTNLAKGIWRIQREELTKVQFLELMTAAAIPCWNWQPSRKASSTLFLPLG